MSFLEWIFNKVCYLLEMHTQMHFYYFHVTDDERRGQMLHPGVTSIKQGLKENISVT